MPPFRGMTSIEPTSSRPEDNILVLQGKQPSEKFDSHYADFGNSVGRLSAQFGSPKTTIIKSLLENTCEYRARYEIEKPSFNSNQKFDSYFTIKHEFQKNKFVQRLCLALKQRGLQTCISTEEKHAVGVFDVMITNAPYLVKISGKNGLKIVIEWEVVFFLFLDSTGAISVGSHYCRACQSTARPSHTHKQKGRRALPDKVACRINRKGCSDIIWTRSAKDSRSLLQGLFCQGV